MEPIAIHPGFIGHFGCPCDFKDSRIQDPKKEAAQARLTVRPQSAGEILIQ
jgi:hypothetical protein